VGPAIETMVWSMRVIATAKIIPVRIRPFDRPPALAVLLRLIVFLLYQDEASPGWWLLTLDLRVGKGALASVTA
jgi:hypothetical protein